MPGRWEPGAGLDQGRPAGSGREVGQCWPQREGTRRPQLERPPRCADGSDELQTSQSNIHVALFSNCVCDHSGHGNARGRAHLPGAEAPSRSRGTALAFLILKTDMVRGEFYCVLRCSGLLFQILQLSQ